MAWAEKRGLWFRVRYRDADGVVRTGPDKYRTKKEAAAAAEEIDTDTRRGVFIDPSASRTSLTDWATQWRAVHHVAPGTIAKYDQYLDNHILPAFGQIGLDEIRRLAVKQWAGELSARYAEATVRGIVTLFSLVMTAAVENQMLATNPIHGLRLASRRTRQMNGHHVKRPVPTADHLLAIAERANDLAGRRGYTMVISAAFTGMRWGELTGLAKPHCHTTGGYLLIDPDIGALHEVGGQHRTVRGRRSTPRSPPRLMVTWRPSGSRCRSPCPGAGAPPWSRAPMPGTRWPWPGPVRCPSRA
jgi:integrase